MKQTDAAIMHDLLNFEEIAVELKCTTRTICRLMNEPDGLPHIRVGKRTFFQKDTVRAWLLSKQQQRNPRRTSRRYQGGAACRQM